MELESEMVEMMVLNPRIQMTEDQCLLTAIVDLWDDDLSGGMWRMEAADRVD